MTRENRLEPRDLVLSSTTETQEALDHAVSENWKKPFTPGQKKEEPKKEEKPKTEEAEVKEPEVEEEGTIEEEEQSEEKAEEKAEEKPETEEEEKPKGKLGWSKRVNKLTARNARLTEDLAEERRKREEIEARLSRLESGKAPEKAEEKQATDDLPNKPTRAQFKSDEEYISSLVKWERANEEHKASVQAENNRMKEIYDGHRERTSEARERYDDWDEVANSPQAKNMRIHPSVDMALMEMENGPDVLYFLATHPEAYEKLESMTVFQGISEITRISDKLAAATKKSAPAKKPRPSLDEPIEPTRRPAKSSKKLEEMNTEDYLAARRQMRQARQRVS